MTRATETATLTLYEEDFYLWLKTTAEQSPRTFTQINLLAIGKRPEWQSLEWRNQ